MKTFMSEFDKVAADWDKNKMHLERSQAIADLLLKHLGDKTYAKALEFGAGTGLLSFILKEKFKEITLIDSSREMVNIANAKILDSGERHMKAIFLDLENEKYNEQFDIIFTQMVMHHVNNVEHILKKFNQLLISGGKLAIADLYTEDGSFHGEDFSGNLGFDPEHLKMMLLRNGYENITCEQCFTIKKEVKENIMKDFPVFLLLADKNQKS